jgi:hypothetical protein
MNAMLDLKTMEHFLHASETGGVDETEIAINCSLWA